MATTAAPGTSSGGARPRRETEVSAAVPFPRYSIALVQNESEMLQAPAYDIHIFLERDPVFDVELFTERSFHSLPGESSRFDCIVIGHNAAYGSADVRRALEEQPPAAGLCVLYQMDSRGLSFLEERVELHRFRGVENTVRMAGARKPQDEVLLNWPQPVPLVGGSSPDEARQLSGAHARSGLVPQEGTNWRAVLETEHGGRAYPVVLRSPTRRDHQMVVCTALLSQARPAQAALLRNMITWCAAGRPDVVVVETPDDRQSSFVHRKLRLQGAKAIAHEVPADTALDFGEWPLRGVENVILPRSWADRAADDPDGIAGASEWLKRDRRIVSIDGDGNLVIRHGASDDRWVARKWAEWFAGVKRETWHGERPEEGSLVRTRAILRALVELRDQLDDDTATQLGMPDPGDLAEPCRKLLDAELGRNGSNVRGSVSLTTAALEIDRAIGGHSISLVQKGRIKRWLRERARELDEAGQPVLAAEDRLEIARCLGNADGTRKVAADVTRDVAEYLARELEDDGAVGGDRKSLAAILVTKLREAVVASGLEPGDIPERVKEAERSVDPDVRESPLLAANYLIAWSRLRQHWHDIPDDPLVHEKPGDLDRVIISIGKHGVLVRGGSRRLEHQHELMSAEALALRAYFDWHKTATHMLPGVGTTPEDIVTALAEEASALRASNVELPGLRLAVKAGKLIAGVVTLALVAAACILVERNGLALPLVPELTIPAVALALLLAAKWGLDRVGLMPRWLDGLIGKVAERVGWSREEKPPEPPAQPRTA